jgi:hypothetical protein
MQLHQKGGDMNQRLRILAAAAEMKRFTAYDLAAATGVSTNTVRSTLGREDRYFEVSSSPGTERSRGRPANLYLVCDEEGLRGELADIRESLEWTPVPRLEISDGEHNYARLEAGENSLRRALASGNYEDRRKLINVALRTADVLLEQTELPMDLSRKAMALKASAAIAGMGYREPPERSARLRDVATTIATIVEYSAPTALALLRGLLVVTRELHLAPPVGLMVHGDFRPENLLVADSESDWTMVSSHRDWELWSPSWSMPLAEHSVLAGVVLRAESDQADIASLSELRVWTPKIVMGDYNPDLINQTAKVGALFLSRAVEDLAESVIEGIGESLDQRIATIDIGEDPVIADFVSSSQRGELVLEVDEALEGTPHVV